MPGSVFPLGKDAKGGKVKNLMVRIHWKECRYSGTWVGKRRLKIWVTLLISVCFLINNQFENKEEKNHNAALLLLVSHQEETLMYGLKSKLIFMSCRSSFFFLMEAMMSLLLALLLVDERGTLLPHILGIVQFPIMTDMDNWFLFSRLHDGKRSNPLAENTNWKVHN